MHKQSHSIDTEAGYQAAMKRLQELCSAKPGGEPADHQELSTLALLVEQYEDRLLRNSAQAK